MATFALLAPSLALRERRFVTPEPSRNAQNASGLESLPSRQHRLPQIQRRTPLRPAVVLGSFRNVDPSYWPPSLRQPNCQRLSLLPGRGGRRGARDYNAPPVMERHHRPHAIGRRGTACAAALVVAVAAVGCEGTHPSAHAPVTLRYMTAGPGEFSSRLAQRVQEALPEAQVQSIATTGSLVVLSALQEGRGEFGFSFSDVAYLAYRKGLDSEPFPHTNLRAIAVRWMSTMYALVPEDSPVTSLHGLVGRRVGIVQAGNAGELLTRFILEAHGLHYVDVQPIFMEAQRLGDALARHQLDAAMLPATPLIDVDALLSARHLRKIALDRAAVEKLQAEYPFIKSVSLDTGFVSSIGRLSVGVDSVLVCRADLDESIVYSLTRVFYGILSELAHTQQDIDPGEAAATPIPLHPGAARFYREREVLNES